MYQTDEPTGWLSFYQQHQPQWQNELNPSHGDISPLSHFGLIEISGVDAQRFLQGQLSCDVDSCLPGQTVLGSLSTPKGRMVCNFRCLNRNGIFLLSLSRDLVEATLKHLSKYSVFFKTKMTDISEHQLRFGCNGDRAKQILGNIGCKSEIGLHQMVETDLAYCLHSDHNQYEIWLKNQDHWPRLKVSLLTVNKAWQQLDWHKGICWVSLDSTNLYLPEELNWDLLNGINFEKGCYTGQEVIARMHYRGQAKKRMFIAKCSQNQNLSVGQTVHDETDKKTGEVAGIINYSNAEQGLFLILNKQYASAEHYIQQQLIKICELPYSIYT